MPSKPLLLSSLLLVACSSAPVAPRAYVAPPPPTTAIQVCWIDTGGVSVSGGLGAGGSTQAKTWDVTSAAILVRHPNGDLLIDAGISPQAKEEAGELGVWKRFVFSQTAGRNQPRRSLVESLRALGVTRLKAVLLSHAHPDHVGGVVALPGVPIWLSAEERDLVDRELTEHEGIVVPAHARSLQRRMVSLPFAARPYASYARSFDVFGDGSVVVVPTFGHTPGSVATFVNLSPTRRFVHVGDLINLQESIDRGVGKSWLMRRFTDEDGARTEAEVATLVELHRRDPALTILPAHDKAAFEALFGKDTGTVPPCIASAPPSAGR